MSSLTDDNKGLFWDSYGGDRQYNAASFEKWIKKFFSTGVFSGDLGVVAGTGMKVILGTGYVNVNGKVKLFESDEELTIEMADSTSPRIDTIVIERNDNDREIVAKVVMGEPAATPLPCPPVRTSTIYQLVVAEVYVAAGTTSITQNDITRKVADDNVCGVVKGTLSNNEITYGNTDLEAGVSELADGQIYFMYE